MSKVKDPKTKLTLSIESGILKDAKKTASQRKIPVSRLVENYLKWLAKPDVYCFNCGEKFSVTDSKVCPKCGWLICPKCKACRCSLSEEVASALFHMRKTLEDLIGGRLK
jgi:rRNA maturation endonuclease Nob1